MLPETSSAPPIRCREAASASSSTAATWLSGSGTGAADSHARFFSWEVEYRARRVPTRELPRRSRSPNHGAASPSTIVSNHKDTSASSTAVALRSTP